MQKSEQVSEFIALVLSIRSYVVQAHLTENIPWILLPPAMLGLLGYGRKILIKWSFRSTQSVNMHKN